MKNGTITDNQLGAIARLAKRPGTPTDIRDRLEQDSPLFEYGTKGWGVKFIGKLIDGEWDWLREEMEEIEEEFKSQVL